MAMSLLHVFTRSSLSSFGLDECFYWNFEITNLALCFVQLRFILCPAVLRQYDVTVGGKENVWLSCEIHVRLPTTWYRLIIINAQI